MTQIMTAAEMTDGQIENAVNKLRDAMRKHRSEITSDVAQQVLGVENLGMIMFTPFHERAEAVSNLIVLTAKVNRGRSEQEAIEVTGRAQCTDRKVVDSMPKGEDDEVEVVFFKPDLSERNGYISDDDLEKEFELRGLKPADPISVAAVNEADRAFADEKPHGTHWKDAKGNWCCAAFRRWFGRREVLVYRNGSGWHDLWWFAGVRKQPLRKEPCWTNGQVTQVTQPKTKPSILELVSTIVIPATTSRLVAKEKFVINTKRNAPVKISAVWENFTTWFLSGKGKTEAPISEQTLRYYKLRQSSVDGPIITELGGEEKSETTLTEMFSLMEKQKNGEYGVLLNNGCANIFYIRDQNGVLRAVDVHWDGGGWDVYADSVEDAGRGDGGGQVFSCNSVLESSETSAPAQA